MCHELGISARTLNSLTKAREFIDAYTDHFVDLGTAPCIRSNQAAIADMLPVPTRELKSLLTNGDTPATVKFQVIKDIYRIAGVSTPEVAANDRSELAKFLKENKVTVEELNVNISPPVRPQEDVVDGEVVEQKSLTG